MDVTKPPEEGLPGGVRRAQPRSRPAAIGGLDRSNPFVRAVALAWRRLTNGGGKTLAACSGGADSTALLLALALTTREIVVAHVVHDLRPRDETRADRDAVKRLAEGLGVPFVEAEVRVAREKGNKEALARRARYAALDRLARAAGCSAVATAHHADDQFETVLMALMRGAGLRGLRGIAPKRRLRAGDTGPARLVRPMLGVTREEARAVCRCAGVGWREDATNRDVSRLRAALRERVMLMLTSLRPGASRRASSAAEALRDAAAAIESGVREAFGEGFEWPRERLRRQPRAIVVRGLIRAAQRLLAGRRFDRITSRLARESARAVRDGCTDPRRFEWPGGIVLTVSAHRVLMSRHAGR
jgi:tRNA(Ile)-lysidine synthase